MYILSGNVHKLFKAEVAEVTVMITIMKQNIKLAIAFINS
jgi:hypothetical protein